MELSRFEEQHTNLIIKNFLVSATVKGPILTFISQTPSPPIHVFQTDCFPVLVSNHLYKCK